jgi:hypothetical protein
VEIPRCVDRHELGHPLEDLRSFRSVGHRPRLLIEPVEQGQLEPGQIGESRVAAVEERQKAEAFGRRVDVAEEPHLQLPESRGLEVIGKFLAGELHAQTDAVHAALPQLAVLPVEGSRTGRDLQHQRPAIRQVAEAVLVAIDVAELVEERFGGRRIELRMAVELRVVAGDVRRNRLCGRHGLARAEDADLLVDVVGHADRAPQRDLLRRVAADHRILHVEIRIRDRGLDAARSVMPSLARRLELVARIGTFGTIGRHRT